MLVYRTPQQVRFASQRDEHLVKVPRASRLAPRHFGALGESSAKLVAPATDRFVRDHDTTLAQQLLNVAQAQVKPEIPSNRTADDDAGEAVAVIKRSGLLHHFILPPPHRQPDSAEQDAARALRAGFDAHLGKPVTLNALLHVIGAIM
jgi:hypothetical protein